MAYKKTILVTGGAGFIGSHLLNKLVSKYPEYYFINLDALTKIADLSNVLVANEPNYKFIKADIRDRNALQEIFASEGITDVIHLAAESHVDVSIENPHIFVETNVNGTANLLALSLQHHINRFHHVSTDEVYGSLTLEDEPFTELSPISPNSPYSATKAASDNLVRAFKITYGLDTVITRCSNNYGPHQDKTKFIPNAVNKLFGGEHIPVYGDGSNVRDWLYVEDHVNALDLVFHAGESGEVYNIGGGVEKTNLELAEQIAAWANRPEAISFVTDRKGHDFRYAINDQKIRSLGYEPQTQWEDGIEVTLTWHKNKFA